RNRSASAITETDEKLIAALASMGERSRPRSDSPRRPREPRPPVVLAVDLHDHGSVRPDGIVGRTFARTTKLRVCKYERETQSTRRCDDLDRPRARDRVPSHRGVAHTTGEELHRSLVWVEPGWRG